jgi:hypothetical protein
MERFLREMNLEKNAPLVIMSKDGTPISYAFDIRTDRDGRLVIVAAV